MHDIKTLDEYLQRYGSLLGKQAEERLRPLHVPGRDELPTLDIMRTPFPAQHHVIAGGLRALRKQKSLWVCADMGTGKTLIGAATAHEERRGRPYRHLVFCPGHLVKKWEREIRETIPGSIVTQIESWKQLLTVPRMPRGSEWFILGRDRAKFGADWRAAIYTRPDYLIERKDGEQRGTVALCPKCMGEQRKKDGTPHELKRFSNGQRYCENEVTSLDWVKTEGGEVHHLPVTKPCGNALYSYMGKQQDHINRWAPARYIHKKMRGYFDTLILDEAHEEKSEDSEQAVAAGSLGAACRKCILMTGTLIGGYANHVRPLLFRFAPNSVVEEGLTWEQSSQFTRLYGRMEKTITETEGSKSSGRQGRTGSSKYREVEKPKPGIMPALFGRHLIGQCVYLSLDEVAANLPKYNEIIRPVPMSDQQRGEYKRFAEELRQANAELLVKGNKALLGAMIATLLSWPDYPYDWTDVGYWVGNKDKPETRLFVPVTRPASFDPAIVQPKEQELINICKEEIAAGRQCWVFVQYTDTHDVQGRVVDILQKAGIVAAPLRAASVATGKREEWIEKKGQQYDVIVSHPKPVETGLDLFDKGGGHNFSTLIFYETGYVTNTLRQASKRSWRIGQHLPCRVYFLYYEETAQSAAMMLMGQKLAAAQSIEGKFSTEGLVAMGGDDVDIQLALAKSLDSVLTGETTRVWAQLDAVSSERPEPVLGMARRRDGFLFDAIDLDADDVLLKGSLDDDLADLCPEVEDATAPADEPDELEGDMFGFLDDDDELDDLTSILAVGEDDPLDDL